MCDFHSIVVRRDGAIAHLPSNSHSGAVEAAKWTENDRISEMRGVPRFVEAEWDGDGAFPGAAKVARGELTETQRKVIESHYEALAKLLSDPGEHAERMLFGDGIFADDKYADIRWRVLINPKCPKRVADKLVILPLHANGEPIKSFDPRITKLEGNLVVASGYEIHAPALTEVGGYLAVYSSAKLDALQKVGGYLDVRGQLIAPKLKQRQ